MSLKLVKRPGSAVWYIRGSIDRNRIFETTKTGDRKLAEQFKTKREAELYEELRLGRRGAVSFVSAAVAYLEFEERGPNTTKKVLRLANHFKDKSLSAIGQAQADSACALLRDGAAPATRIREIYTPLASIINFAARRKWCERVEFDRPETPSGKTRWITPTEALTLIRSAAPHLQPLIRFILCTGARMAEALDLDWADVDLKSAHVRFRDTKPGRDRIAALPASAVVTLANLPFPDPKKVRAGRVFRADNGAEYTSRQRLSGGQTKTAWRTACIRAGLSEPLTDKKGKPVLDAKKRPVMVPTLTPHDLRHTWASWFYCLSKDLLLLKHEGDWASLNMVQRYAHLVPADLRDQISLVWGPTHPRLGNLPMNDSGTGCASSAPPIGAES